MILLKGAGALGMVPSLCALLLALLPSKALSLSVSVRLATPSDLPAVARLQLDAFDPVAEAPPPPTLFSSLFAGGGGGGDRKGRAERLAQELAQRVAKGSDIFVAEAEDGALVGSCDLSDAEMASPFHAIAEGIYLSSTAVDAGSRRQGIASSLVTAAEDRAVARGSECVWLFVERDNPAATALYKGLGYAQQAESPRHAAFAAALAIGQKEPLLFRKNLPCL